MTTFSRFLLNPQKREGRKLLTNPQALHAAVRAAFPPDLDEAKGRILWRLDSDGHTQTLYIVAPEAPDLGHLVEQAGWASRPGDSAAYDRMLASVRTGARFAFRLTGNPVHRDAAEGRPRGTLHPHVTVAQQLEWLRRKGERHGFSIGGSAPDAGDADSAELTATVTRRADLSFLRGRGEAARRVTVRTAQFDGTLQVTDADELRQALTSGIGRAKAYGCGLLTLAPVTGRGR